MFRLYCFERIVLFCHYFYVYTFFECVIVLTQVQWLKGTSPSPLQVILLPMSHLRKTPALRIPYLYLFPVQKESYIF